MTTHTFTGFTAQFFDNDTVGNVSSATGSIVVPDGVTSFQYQILNNFGDFNDIAIFTPINNVRLNEPGAPLRSFTVDTLPDLDVSFGVVNWGNNNNSFIIIFSVPAPVEDQQFIFQVGGAPLPLISNAAQLQSFTAQINFTSGVNSGPFGPNQPISFASIPNRTTSENDLIQGGTGDDTLDGGAGNDTINTGGGVDFERVIGSVGNDLININPSSNQSTYFELAYNTFTSPITANFNTANNTATVTGSASGNDTITGVATQANDLTGDGMRLVGTRANDTFNITVASESFFEVRGGRGDDTFNITLNGGTFRWAANQDGNQGAFEPVIADFSAGTITQDGFGGSDTINIVRNGGANSGRLSIQTNNGNDSVRGTDGRDEFIPGAGVDTIDGAGGFDRVRYDRDVNSVVVDLEAGIATGFWEGEAFTHNLSNIEDVRGSRSATSGDVIRGDGGENYLDGREGNDLLDGRGGDDTLIGGAGNDTLIGGSGNNALVGDAGNDTYVIDGRNTGDEDFIAFDNQGLGTLRILNFPGFDGGDFFVDGADLVRISNQGHVTRIEGGTQTVQRVEWTNTAQDGISNTLDLITNIGQATRSNFTLAGTQGSDNIVAPNFANTGWGEAYLNGGNDIFTANANYTTFVNLGAGNDRLNGSSGNDWARGQDGDDSFNGGDGNDTFHGEAGDDTLLGGGGDDQLYAYGDGADVIDGGAGFDTVIYDAAMGRVLVDLQSDVSGAGFARFFTEGAGSGDTYAGIENAAGGDFADNLRGDGAANVLQGGGVSDRLYGRAGDDTLEGGTGADALYGNLGADVMTGGDDAGRRDRFIYFQANETGVGAGNRDVITDFVSGEDRIELSRIDADITQGLKQRFDFIGDAAFSGTGGELRYEQVGGITLVQADRDGDGVADFEIELTGTLTLTASDFLI